MSGKSNIRLMRAVLELASDIIGCKDTITIDSGIYGHYWLDTGFDVAKDLITVSPTQDGSIGYDDLQGAIDYMMAQFDSLGAYDRSYFLDDVYYDDDEKRVTLVWGS